MSHYVTIRFDFSDTSKYASIPLYIGFPATFIPFFIYIQSELSPLNFNELWTFFCILQVPIQGHQIAHFGQSSVTKSLQKNYRLIIVTIFMLTH